MEATTTAKIYEAQLAAEHRTDDKNEVYATGQQEWPTDEELDARSDEIFTEELEARGLTMADWDEYLAGLVAR